MSQSAYVPLDGRIRRIGIFPVRHVWWYSGNVLTMGIGYRYLYLGAGRGICQAGFGYSVV